MVLPAVRDVVFNPYLSEMILARLPTQDILRCMRVCRDWHGAIKSSVVLRRNLFLESSKSKPVPIALPIDPEPSRPGILQAITGCRCGSHLHPPLALPDPILMAFGYIPNTLLFQVMEPVTTGFIELKALNPDLLHGATTDVTSATNMFITQPPIQNLMLWIDIIYPPLKVGAHATVNIAGGITWGAVVKVVKEVISGKDRLSHSGGSQLDEASQRHLENCFQMLYDEPRPPSTPNLV
ncbi:hypothetical protein KVT40_004562 [Elsinoe batatas]|uniref:F-box domain-containing protein n=1 Tax=Elsinoe batatas TaxID=2601811 RepID=A0A8K0KZW3_9PEZI|nr:hypothetical protein KVT40_004562 [Elsinoe batatas]